MSSLASIPGLTEKMIGYKLRTKQTTEDGVKVRRVMVAESLDIARETYFAILMDRAFQGPVMVGSPDGGMDIEEVAAKNPERIFKVSNLKFEVAHYGNVLFQLWDVTILKGSEYLEGGRAAFNLVVRQIHMDKHNIRI